MGDFKTTKGHFKTNQFVNRKQLFTESISKKLFVLKLHNFPCKYVVGTILMDFLQKRIRQQDLSRKEGESKDFQWVINYSNLNLLPPFGKMCLLNFHQLESCTRDNKIIKNIHSIYQMD